MDSLAGSEREQMFDPARMLSKSELLESLRLRRQEWDSVLAQFEAPQMTVPGAAGYWSVKDVVAHIAYYEAWLVSWLGAAAQGDLPADSVLDNDDIEWRNLEIYELTHNLDLEQVLQASAGTFQQLLDLLEAFPDEYFDDPRRSEWFMQPYWSSFSHLSEAIANYTWEHYQEHLPDLRRWIEAGRG